MGPLQYVQHHLCKSGIQQLGHYSMEQQQLMGSAEILSDPQSTSTSREGQSPNLAQVSTLREKSVDDLDGKSPRTPFSQEMEYPTSPSFGRSKKASKRAAKAARSKSNLPIDPPDGKRGMSEDINLSVNGQSRVPPGFRFHSTEELLHYYLMKKVASEKIDVDVIRNVDLHKLEPWDIQEKCKIGSTPQNDWYFFSHKDKKYPTRTRTNRTTAAGLWKATGRDKVKCVIPLAASISPIRPHPDIPTLSYVPLRCKTCFVVLVSDGT
ncbi:hypothetical protein Vadar_020114 [Vaccinium darrowii]|uniref:Uncharacterized protein n=1 Tax=Vaccinium darrowii TaxID=229202 RepID=A0ACB7YPD7_9ERIC|nr:hypothetical protein Vadar_020114 [Vaccinium darrowii]